MPLRCNFVRIGHDSMHFIYLFERDVLRVLDETGNTFLCGAREKTHRFFVA